MITNKTLKTLEFNRILDGVADHCVNDEARDLTLELLPETEFRAVQDLLTLTEQADRLLFVHTLDPIVSFDPMDAIFDKAPVMSILSLAEILRTAHLFRASRIFQTAIAGVNDDGVDRFKRFAEAVYVDIGFEKEVERCILSEDEIADSATDELFAIRKKIRRCNAEIKDKLQFMIRSADMQKYLQDNIVTMREGRYVVPVRQEYKNQVSGLIHDQSASGATVFIEPLAVVEANNALKSLYMEEQTEIERILRSFTSKIGGVCHALKINLEILIECDIYFAKAKYAHCIRAIKPLLSSNGEIEIKRGRHPLIKKDKVVPVSVRLGKEFRFLVITGPNTGGKTVTLKLTGLFCLMAMAGLFLPCDEESMVSVFDQIYCDIGDEQSIEQSLSAFSSHITNVSTICDHVNEKSLVLLDELGSSTDPAEGSAIALAVTEYLIASGCKGIITTHFGELKEYSLVTDGIENASMAFDPTTYAPTYKLNIGVPGSSNAIEMANRLKLNPSIVARAKSFVAGEKLTFEKVLRQAEESRFQMEAAREQIERDKSEYSLLLQKVKDEQEQLQLARENISKNVKLEVRKLVNESASEADEILEEMKSLLKAQDLEEKDLFRARELKKGLENLIYATKEEEFIAFSDRDLVPLTKKQLVVGLKVYVKSLQTIAVIAEITKKGEVKVNIGNLNSYVALKDLYHTKQDDKKNKPAVSYSPAASTPVRQGVQELKLLGSTVDEALPLIDSFLDNAYVCGLNEVKIIHGIGTGALMRGVQKHLKGHSLVDSFRFGVYGEGEHGVTVVTMVKRS